MANGADNLRQVLEGYEQERIQLSLKFLNQALVAATLNDNHECIAKLIKMGARNIDECIQLAKKKRLVNATAMLLLMRAALTGDETCLKLAHELQREGATDSLEHSFLREVALIMQCGGRLSTFDAVVVAQQNGRYSICRKLMMLTGTNRHEGYVNWSKLSLASIDAQLLETCTWITDLDLSANKLSTIPSAIGILSMMTNANFSSNDLTNVPANLLQLCELEKLNLSHNKINDLPDIPYWSASLLIVDLSDNHLSSLPMTIGASGLNSLNLSNNQFSTVPLCICTFTALISLDLSENPNIRNLPCELGMLTSLVKLNLNGLKRLKEPPKALTSSAQQCITYLHNKLSSYDDSLQSIQLMIVGNPGSGKHALISRLQNRQLTSHECNLQIYINEWECRPSITKRAVHFRTWVFNRLEDYKSFTHNCFLLQRSLYLLLFDMTKSESEGVHDVKVWLENITYKAPYSSVMIIGTHNTTARSHRDHCNDFLIQQAKMVASVYEHRLETVGFFQIGLKHQLKAISSQLLDNIYSYAINYPLLQLERAVIREIGIDGDRVTELLNHGKEKFDDKFLSQALEFATQMDSASNVGKVASVCSWPSNINLKQCIVLAEREEKHHAHTMLLLVTAALSGVKEILHQISFEPAEHRNVAVVCCYSDLFSVNVSTRVPIEIAQQNNQNQVMNELLMTTDVYPDEGYICWGGLQLQKLDLSLLMKIYWVQILILSRNKLTTLPQEINEYLQQVVKIDLQYNDLAIVPKCLLELPSLGELNLAHNKLQELPEVPKWSPNLKILDLSDNQLSSLPSNVIAPVIHSLNIANNKFHAVPLCICSFTTLQSLNLSGNSNIVSLPREMGRLCYLDRLNLSGLKHLREPPKSIQKECRECIRYLNNKLCMVRGFYRMKMMILGCANRGKTTLVARLLGLGEEYGGESTFGLDISEWWYRPSVGRRNFHFSIWDFAGGEKYYATHQCFLSQCSLYLLLFNLRHGDKGVEELRPWLDNLALRAPHSCVIIIGTHLDEIPDEDRGEIDELLQRVGTLAASYNRRLQIVEVLPVGLKNRIEHIGLLKEVIHGHAANYKNRAGQLIMGRKISASYHALDKQLETVQHEVRQGIRKPIMHVEEFNMMVKQMNLPDIQDDTEKLRIATLFLTDIGSLLHFDDRGHNLNELFFVDPCWLYDMMSKLITIKEGSPFIKSGIIYSKDIPTLFKDKQFPWQYFEQYLTLLDRFEIALPLDNQRVLIPSMLPDGRPKEFKDEMPDTKDHVYSRFIMFSSASTPPGFWGRLLSRIMYSVPKVCYALDRFSPTVTPNNNNDKADLSFSMHPTTLSGDEKKLVSINAGTNASLNMPTASSSSAKSPADNPGSPSPFITSPTISGPLPFITAQLPFINPPQLLPNFPKPLPNDISNSFDTKNIQLEYWQTGLYYKDSEIMFRIESLTGTKQFKTEKKEGVHVIASANNFGKKIIGQLIDLVVSLVDEWYPGLHEGKHGSYGLEQKVPCFECIIQGRARPYEFKVEQCLPMIAMNETTVECGYFHNDPAKNHHVSLGDIVPDLLLQDIDPEFLLDAMEINYQEDDTSLLGKGGYGKVYRGKCKGRPVAIKKYNCHREEYFRELRSEVKLLQQSHHPCIVCPIGVCVYPLWAIILEEAPLKSLEFPILKRNIPCHRLTIFRIAAEVAAALCFLHSRGIIYRDLKAASVLLWTLDPDSLCHCKLAGFGIASHLSPVGTRGLLGKKGFIAPEVLHINKRKQRSTYDYRADIFSFAMFLYQLISRRHPYHNIPPHRLDVAIEQGDRPKLQDVYLSRTGYHYLTQVMKACWEDSPKKRLDTNTIIEKICQAPAQMVMCVQSISGKRSLCQAITITPSAFAKAGHPNRLQNELWVWCDGANDAEISMFNTHHMMKVNHVFIRDSQVQCMTLCGDHVWVASRAGIEYGVIDIISIGSKELVHNFHIREKSVSCITATDKTIYLGTLEGYCFSFSNDISASSAQHCKYVSEHAIDGIACTPHCVWVAHTKYIHFLNFDNLALEDSTHRKKTQDAIIGQIFFNAYQNIVWSAHLGGVILSAWDADKKYHMYDIDAGRRLKNISCINFKKNADYVMTAVTPALDTVWVGMATGHIMVFHETELLSWFHPYEECVRFLTLIPSPGPCEMEKAMVASGGKRFRPLVEGLDKGGVEPSNSSESGTLIIWEAYEAKTIKQIMLIEQNAPNHLNDYSTVCQMIKEGGFRDGTHLISPNSEDPTVSEVSFKESGLKNSSPILPSSDHEDYDTDDKNSSPVMLEDEQIPPQSPSVTNELNGETFNINLLDSKQTVLIQCSKPVTLKSLYDKIRMKVAQDYHYLVYYRDEEAYELQTQENLDEYLKLPDKPQLCIVKTEIVSPKIHHVTERSSEEEISIRIMGQIEQNLKLTCTKPAQLDVLMNEMTSLESLRNQKFNLVYPATSSNNSSEMEVTTQEDFDKYLAMPNRLPLLVKMEENTDSFSITEDTELACTVSSSSDTQLKIATESTESDATDDVILHFKLFDSEYTIDVACTKPLRLEAVLNDLKLIANLEDQDWQLVYSIDESCVKIETQEDFDRYLSMDSASTPILWITGVDT